MTAFFRKIRYTLLGGFLLRPLILAVSLSVAGALLSHLEEWVPGMNSWLPTVWFPSRSDPETARLILSTIASAMMTVVSIVFAILLMTLTLASMQFSPRIITNFIEDRVTQYTLGIFLGTFAYCIAAIPAARTLPQPFAPILTVTGAMLLAFICSCCLLFFINHISEAISASHLVDRLASQTVEMIDELMPPERGQIRAELPVNINTYTNQTPILSNRSGYIRLIDARQLLHFARLYQTDVQVVRRVGHYVPVGIPLLVLSSDREITKAIRNDFRSAFDLGPTRTLQQDVEFGILKIVDIALKAISPAVNDPSTAINCVDHLSAILIHFASRHPPDDILTDTDGKVFVTIPWLDFERLVDSAFEQIRMYSRTDVAVSLRMFRALGDIGHTVPDPAARKLLVERGRRILAGCSRVLEDDEIIEMKERMRVLEELANE